MDIDVDVDVDVEKTHGLDSVRRRKVFCFLVFESDAMQCEARHDKAWRLLCVDLFWRVHVLEGCVEKRGCHALNAEQRQTEQSCCCCCCCSVLISSELFPG